MQKNTKVPTNGILKETSKEEFDSLRKAMKKWYPILIDAASQLSYVFTRELRKLTSNK